MLKNFLNDEGGLETVEYAIITGLVVVGTLTVIAAIGGWANGSVRGLQGEAGGAGSGGGDSAPPTGPGSR